jgi:Ca2+:H+ antiporter
VNRIYYLLIFIPISIIFHILNIGGATTQFLVSGLAIVPLAALLGESTEEIAKYTGPKLGGFLGATFGNITELIISIFALKAGLFDVVKASVAGALIGNVLLVLGFSMFMGGMKYKTQKFSKNSVNTALNLLTIAVIGLLVPAVCTNNIRLIDVNPTKYEGLSIAIAVIMLIVYLCSLYFSFFTHRDIYGAEHELVYPKWSKKKSILVLLVATLIVALESDLLVENIEPMTVQLGLSKLFVGLIIIPIIGNAAEHATAVIMALKNKMDIAIEIAVGSSLQIILFIAPLLVILSLIFKPMTLIFNLYEILALVVSVIIANMVCTDGESNWLEGLQLVSVYLILAVTFFLV